MERACIVFIKQFLSKNSSAFSSVLHCLEWISVFQFCRLAISWIAKKHTLRGGSVTKAVLCPPGLLVGSKRVSSAWQEQWLCWQALHTGLLFDIKNQKLQNTPTNQPSKRKINNSTYTHTKKALLILLLRKKVTVGADRQQPGCPNTSAALKEKKTRNCKSTQPVSGVANDSCSLYMETGHLGSRSLCCCPRNSLWRFGGLWQLLGQHKDAGMTGPWHLPPGTVSECATSTAALAIQVQGCKCVITRLFLFWDKRPLSQELRPCLAGVTWVFADGGDLGEEELESNLNKKKYFLHLSSALILVNLHKWKQNINNLFKSIVQAFTIAKIKYFRRTV